jgi:hypothetical protein
MSLAMAVENPNEKKDDTFRISAILQIAKSSLKGDSQRISKLLGSSSPDISKIASQRNAYYYRIWEIGDWHDSLYEILSYDDGSFRISRRNSLGDYKVCVMSEQPPKFQLKAMLDNFIQDPFPISEKGPPEGTKDDTLFIIERYSSESGYRWGLRTLGLTTRLSVVDMVKFHDELGKMKWHSE